MSTWKQDIVNATVALAATFYEKVRRGSQLDGESFGADRVFHTPLGDNRVVSWMVGHVRGNAIYISDFVFGVDSRVVQVMRGIRIGTGQPKVGLYDLRTKLESLIRGSQETETHYLIGKGPNKSQGLLDDYLDSLMSVISDPQGLAQAIIDCSWSSPVATKGASRWAMAMEANVLAAFSASKWDDIPTIGDIRFGDFVSDTEILVNGDMVAANEHFANHSLLKVVSKPLAEGARRTRVKGDTVGELTKATSTLQARAAAAFAKANK